MEEDRRRDRGGEVYRPANQEEGGSNSDAASPTNGGLPPGSAPLPPPRSALGPIVRKPHWRRPGGGRTKPPPHRGPRAAWGELRETGTPPVPATHVPTP